MQWRCLHTSSHEGARAHALMNMLAGVLVPNAFTPNGDGKNDQIKPLIFGEISAYHFSIFNRWGQVVFDTNDPEKGWDGRSAGLNQGNDSFIYPLTGSFILRRE